MSTANPSRLMGDATVRLSRVQRDAIRDELDEIVGIADDLALCFQNRDRPGFMRLLAKVNTYVATLDAIGWHEPEDRADVELVDADGALRDWAMAATDDLASVFENSLVAPGRADEILDRMSALRAFAGQAA